MASDWVLLYRSLRSLNRDYGHSTRYYTCTVSATGREDSQSDFSPSLELGTAGVSDRSTSLSLSSYMIMNRILGY